MKNLKPSQLPVSTVIGTRAPHYDVLYIKRADGIWEDFDCDYCDGSERISDTGCSSEDRWKSDPWVSTDKTSDEYFKNFTIIAAPPGYVFDKELLHGVWIYELAAYADGTLMHDCKGFNCDYRIESLKRITQSLIDLSVLGGRELG